MTIEAAKRGYAFANVRPRGDRNFETKTINLVFVVEEGAALTSSASTFAAIPVRATTSSAANSISAKVMPIIAH